MQSFLLLIFVLLLFQHSTISQDLLNNPHRGFLPNYARTAAMSARSLGNSTEKGRLRHVESLNEISPSSRGFHLGGEIESRSLSEPSDLFSAIFNAPAAISDLFMNFIHHNDKWIVAPRLTKPHNRSPESVGVISTAQDSATTPTATTAVPRTTEPLLLPYTELGDYWNPNFRPVYARPPPPPKSYFLKKIKALAHNSPETTTTEAATAGTTQEEITDYTEALSSAAVTETSSVAPEVDFTTTTEKLYPVSVRMTTLPVTGKPNPVEDVVEQAFKEAREEAKADEQEPNEGTMTTLETPSELPPESGNLESEPVVQDSTTPVTGAPEATDPTERPTETTPAAITVTVTESIATPEPTTVNEPEKPQRVGKTISDHHDSKTNPLSEKLSRRRFSSLLDLSLRRGSKRT